MKIDPIELSQELIRCPSITPVEAGALDLLQGKLEALGFTCHRLPFEEEGAEQVDNLYARIGAGSPHICFAGHTDVVPPGDESEWKYPPFAAKIVEEGVGKMLYGRGTVDMKCAIAAFVSAAAEYLQESDILGENSPSISLLITGDEEADAINGTKKVLSWLEENNYASGTKFDGCLVGEPTNANNLGDMAKIGRRGSLCADITVNGIQGHVAYQQLADNPITRLIETLHVLKNHKLDNGTEHFLPSNLEVTSIDVRNEAGNVIPAHAEAKLNIRFNTNHTRESLKQWIEEICSKHSDDFSIKYNRGSEAFLTEPGLLSNVVSSAIEDKVGSKPELGTTGGTSDARFIKDYCPVVEFGLINQTAHKVNEFTPVADIEALAKIYKQIISSFLK